MKDIFEQKNIKRENTHLLHPAIESDIRTGMIFYIDNYVLNLFKETVRKRYNFETENQYKEYLDYFRIKIKYNQLFKRK